MVATEPPKPSTPQAQDPKATHTDLSSFPEVTGTDLSLPSEVAAAMARALEKANYQLRPTDTVPFQSTNIRFHRIIGKSGNGPSLAALLYVDDERLEACQDSAFFYAVCIRICRHIRATPNASVCLIFLAPERTRFPEHWSEQGEEFETLGVATAVRFRRVPAPMMWRNNDTLDAMQYVYDWIRNVDLRPLRDTSDVFAAPSNNLSGVSIDTTHLGTAVPVPRVFISYAHEDDVFYQKLRLALTQLDNDFPGALWSDKEIEAGEDWHRKIQSAIVSSPVVICLVSQWFLQSEYIRNNELKATLQGAASGEKRILWLYVGKCPVEDAGVGRWQAAHDISQPLDRLGPYELEDQLSQVYRAVRTQLMRMRQAAV